MKMPSKPKDPNVVESERKPQPIPMRVQLKAKAIESYGDILTIEFDGYLLNPEEREMVERLFPNTSERAYELLEREALISCLAPESVVESARMSNVYVSYT